ncbi:GNAT family N-acetyltransferase [Modestobacter sp. VKM Ac-2977]|uniref:GNAT family N-acetyltransferase n=1 Tax=Modestobacter sp. VKM Ac-2977 TaxID=3004131 RepID=UPI003FA5779A
MGAPLGVEDLTVRVQRWRDAAFAAEFYVACVEAELAGMAAVAAVPQFGRVSWTANLMGPAVSDRHRRKGVARALMEQVTSRATTWGCDQIKLTSSRTRDAAHAFYVALGYRDTSAVQARYVGSLQADGEGRQDA